MLSQGDSDDCQSCDYEMTEDDFNFIAGMANSDFGLSLKSDKMALIQSRLSKRLRLLEIDSFANYCALLSTPNGQQESIHMLSALTTNVTHFFREMHHFDAFANNVLPDLRKKAESGCPVRIWSAGCSAGQEPYSISAVALNEWPDLLNFDFKILATDIDPEVLKTAKAGNYSADEIEKITSPYRNLMFSKQVGPQKTISPEVAKPITFARLNLISGWPMSRKFDVIFCRNVAIYFDKPTQVRLWERFHDILKPGGMLCIGHSERLSGSAAAKFKTAGVTMYRRNES